MAFTPRRLIIQGIPYMASQLMTQLLPKVVYRGLHLNLIVNHTNGATVVGLTIEKILSLLARIQVIVNGQDVIASLSGQDLRIMNRYDFSAETPGGLDGTPNVTTASNYHLYLPFGLTRAANPEDTLLDARRVESIVLEVTWGNGTIATSGVTVNSATLDVTTDEYANVPADLSVGRHELSVATRNLDAIGVLPLNLETQSNNQYRRLFVIARDSAGELSSSLISRLAVKSRNFFFFDMFAQPIRFWNEYETGILTLDGVYVITFTRDGRQTQRIDARNLSELIVDVTSVVSSGSIRVLKDKSIFETSVV